MESFLKKLPLLVRQKAVKASIRKGANVVRTKARRLAPRGGPREGAKAGKPHLRDTIKTIVREYQNRTMAFVGPSWPSGNHGHLVEFGFIHQPDGKAVAPQPFLRPAADSTRTQQKDAIEKELKKRIKTAAEDAASG